MQHSYRHYFFDRLRSWWSPQTCPDTSTSQRSSPLGEEAVARVNELRSVQEPSRVLWCFCREGSVVAHFWLRLSVPVSHAEKVSVARLNASVFRELQRFTDAQQISSYEGFQLLLPSLSITGNSHQTLTLPCFSWVMTSAAFLFTCFYCFVFFFYFPETNTKVIDLFQATFGMICFSFSLFLFCCGIFFLEQ